MNSVLTQQQWRACGADEPAQVRTEPSGSPWLPVVVSVPVAPPALSPRSRHQRLISHRLDLLVPHVCLPAPVVAAAGSGDVDWDDGVFQAAGQPGAAVDKEQGAQRLHKGQLAPVERAELFAAVLQGAGRGLARLARGKAKTESGCPWAANAVSRVALGFERV